MEEIRDDMSKRIIEKQIKWEIIYKLVLFVMQLTNV